MRNKLLFSFLMSLMILALMPPIASAHSVYVDWDYGEIEVEAYYGGGGAMKNADVKVYIVREEKEELYRTGKTDENGIFNFTPKPGFDNYRVEVGKEGHQDSLEINLEEGSPEESSVPLYRRIAAGFGYLLGLAGIAIGYLGWKKGKET